MKWETDIPLGTDIVKCIDVIKVNYIKINYRKIL